MSTFKALDHGPCAAKKCDKRAIYRVGAGDEGKVCKDHLPAGVVFAPFLGQQEKFFARRERVVFTGGAVAGGKSLMLLMKFTQQLDVERQRHAFMRKRGKAHKSRVWGAYFRRVTPDLMQIKQRSLEYFNAIDPEARLNEGKGVWNFPNCGDAKFSFAHMEHLADRFKFKSTEFTYCVAGGTPVLMADGAYRAIEKICPGDSVSTLEGPRVVLATHRPGVKPCVRAVVRDASGRLVAEQVHPLDHRVLSTYGVRQPPLGECIQAPFQLLRAATSWPSYESLLFSNRGQGAAFVLSASGRIDSEVSGGAPPSVQQLPELFCPVVLPPRALLRGGSTPSDAGVGVQCATSLADFLDDCRFLRGLGDEPPLHRREASQDWLRQPGDAEEHTHSGLHSDARGPSPRHTRTSRYTWVHPYSMEERDMADGVGDLQVGSCVMSPCGDFEVFDLTVDSANHYITKAGISSNCAFDELTEFEEEQFDYLDTRLRTSDKDIEPYLQCCAASNPDGQGLLWVRRRFIEIAPPETVVRIENKLRDGRVIAFEQIFIPSKLTDNPIMMESGQYEAALMNKRPEVREALLEGNWYVVAGAFLSNIWNSAIHVCEDHDIPDGAKVFRSMDWGMRAPGSCGWWYEDSDGGLTMFAHLRFQDMVAAQVAEKMKAIEIRWGFWDESADKSKLNFGRNPLDSSCFNTAATAGTPTIAKELADNGFRFKPAKKKTGSRLAGARQIQRRLMTSIRAAYADATDPTTRERPMLRFMRSCRSPIATIPVLQSAPDDPEDVDTKGDDHDWDAVMYACLENPVALPTDEEDFDEDDMPEVPARSAHSGLTLGPPIK